MLLSQSDMKQITFCSVGDLVVDRYIHENSATLGGTAFYSALAARDLNVKTSIVSALGNDSFSKKYMDILRKKQIDSTYLQEFPLHTSNITITLDRHGKPDFSEWDLGALAKLDITETIKQFIKSHDISRVALFKTFEHIFEQVHKLRIPDKLKVADFSGGSMYSNEKDIIERFLNGFNIIGKSISESEISDLSYYERLSKQNKTLILLTAGRKGSVVFTKGQKFVAPVRSVIEGNTTGAGDVFLTTFSILYKETTDVQVSLNEATEQVAKFLKDQSHRYTIPL